MSDDTEDDTELLCDSCGCAECEVDDNGLIGTPYGILCGSCHWTHILIDLRDTQADNTALRQRAERAEVEIDLYARSIGWDNHCEYWVLPDGKVKVHIWPGAFYVLKSGIGQAVIAIRARAADAAEGNQ
jgi:hypothetical protein